MSDTTGAVDIVACPTRTWGQCRCLPMCDKCPNRKHTAVHGPLLGEPAGSKPYGHEYRPRKPPIEAPREIPKTGPLSVACPFCHADAGTRCTSRKSRRTATHVRRRDCAEAPHD